MIFRVNIKRRHPKKIAFVDRDGTLIEDVGYLSDPTKLVPIGDAVSSLRKLSRSGFAIFLTSNQAGLAKGKIRPDEFARVKAKFEEIFDPEMSVFDAIFYCPHHVDGTISGLKRTCACRKPGTLMVETGLHFLRNLPTKQNIFCIGDKTIDVMMGKGIGSTAILVETGYGRKDKDRITDPLMLPDYTVKDFDEAAWLMLERV